MTQFLVEQLAKHRGNMRNVFQAALRKGMTEEEISEYMEKMGLGSGMKRKQFIWMIQCEIEQMIVNHPYEQNMDIVDLVVKKWNETHTLTITRATVRDLFEHMLIRHDLVKQSFHALCSGNMESYKLYAREDISLFSQLLVRTVSMFAIDIKSVFSMVQEVLSALFPQVHAKEEAFQVFKSLEGRSPDGKANSKICLDYKRLVEKDKLVFLEGMLQIITPILAGSKDEGVQACYKRMVAPSQMDVQEEKVEEKHVQECVQEEKPAIEASPLVELMQSVDDFAAAMKLQIQALQEKEQAAPAVLAAEVQGQDSLIAELQDETKRLYVQLEEMRQQQAETEYKRFKQFVQQIGGMQSGYLLSEMYEEAQGLRDDSIEITRGRILNLMNSFSSFGLDPLTYGYALGHEITLSKQELRSKFMMNQSIMSTSSDVRVRIVRYGWQLLGQVVVQPLVEEVL